MNSGPMNSTSSALGAALLAGAVAIACAKPLDVQPLPLSANPGHEISQLGLDLSAARSREIDLLAPSLFKRAEQAHGEATELRREGDDVEDILRAVAEGHAALDEAEASSDIARTTLANPWRARMRALEAGASRLGEPFEEVEAEFRELAREIEANDLGDARASREALAERYNALELRAIKERTLDDARRILQRAREAGASEHVPQAYQQAQQEWNRAADFIERQPYADAAMQERAELARFYARRAFELNQAVRAIGEREAEQIVLELEQRLHGLGEALGLPDRRDASFESRIAAIESAVASLRGDRDFVVSQNSDLRIKLADAQEQATQLGGENQALARERELNALFAEAQDAFEPSEAEIYRQEGQLIIRLRALDFPVGEATIGPEDYALLTKVQRAIRVFGNPRVTIEGHTDSTGGAALNQRLSQERAEAVRDYLIANRTLPGHRIVAVGRAAKDPLASNQTAEGRALNRRIDVILDTRRILFIASTDRTAATAAR